MAKWNDKPVGAMGSAAAQPWGNGEVFQVRIEGDHAFLENDTCPDCGEGTCEHAAPDSARDNDIYNITVRDGYYDLFSVLREALDQAQDGKGHERHGGDLPFSDQHTMTITRAVGRGFPLGQAMKKIQESQRMDTDAAKRELLGAINYLAAAILSFEK